jgi:CheY-like chemotaxis protein
MALAEQDVGPEARAHLTEVREAASRASLLVADLLLVGQHGPLSLQPLNIADVLTRLLPALKARAGERVEIRLAPGPDHSRVMADEELIGRIGLIFAERSRETMPGGGTLTIRIAESGEAGERTAILSFQDTGSAPPLHMLPHLFEPYLAAESGGKGRGLGLSIVHGIVKRMGADIAATPGPGSGTEFIITFPARAAAPAAGPSASRSLHPGPDAAVDPRPAETAQGNGETILVAEDDDDLRTLAMKILSRGGYAVLAARDGEEAVDLFERNRESVRLALLDDVMPRMGGRAALARIRAASPGLPAVLCSGYMWSLNGRAGDSAAPFDILQKPWRPRELLRAVRDGLAQG